MTNEMSPEMPFQKNWWLASAHCDVCAVDIRKHHLSRHMQSKGHQARAGLTYEVMPSDIAFSGFLAGVRGTMLVGYESQLYTIAGGRIV